MDGDFEVATRMYQDAALLPQRQASQGDPVAMYCMGEIDFQVIPTNVFAPLACSRSASRLPLAQATLALISRACPDFWKRIQAGNKHAVQGRNRKIPYGSL